MVEIRRADSRMLPPMRGGWMDGRHLLLLLLALVPRVSTSSTPGDSDRRVSPDWTESSVATHDGVGGPSCRDLRDAELILAEHEAQLLDQLESQSARPRERETWKGELDETKASLEDVDRALAAARCPMSSRGS